MKNKAQMTPFRFGVFLFRYLYINSEFWLELLLFCAGAGALFFVSLILSAQISDWGQHGSHIGVYGPRSCENLASNSMVP